MQTNYSVPKTVTYVRLNCIELTVLKSFLCQLEKNRKTKPKDCVLDAYAAIFEKGELFNAIDVLFFYYFSRVPFFKHY